MADLPGCSFIRRLMIRTAVAAVMFACPGSDFSAVGAPIMACSFPNILRNISARLTLERRLSCAKMLRSSVVCTSLLVDSPRNSATGAEDDSVLPPGIAADFMAVEIRRSTEFSRIETELISPGSAVFSDRAYRISATLYSCPRFCTTRPGTAADSRTDSRSAGIILPGICPSSGAAFSSPYLLISLSSTFPISSRVRPLSTRESTRCAASCWERYPISLAASRIRLR